MGDITARRDQPVISHLHSFAKTVAWFGAGTHVVGVATRAVFALQ
jgi:hypothetical protein